MFIQAQRGEVEQQIPTRSGVDLNNRILILVMICERDSHTGKQSVTIPELHRCVWLREASLFLYDG